MSSMSQRKSVPAPGVPLVSPPTGLEPVDRPIVVAISALGVSPAAVRFAVAEAERRGTGVRLVHAVAGHDDPAEAERLWTIALYRLEMAADLARHAAGHRVSVTTALIEGGVVDSVLAVAATAGLVVVERPSHTRLRPGASPSVTQRLALESPSPVVVVPDWWADIPPRLPASVVHLVEEGLVDCLDRTQTAGLLVVDLTAGRPCLTPAVRAALRHASCPVLVLVPSPDVEAEPVTEETANARRARAAGGRTRGSLRLLPDA